MRKCFLFLALLGFPWAVSAQVKSDFVKSSKGSVKNEPVDPPASAHITLRHYLYGNEWLPEGKVWTNTRKSQYGWGFEQRDVNSCAWCGRPMTWKQAAFDKKALPMWLGALALGIADTEYTLSRPCMKAHTCREGNPALGNTRGRQYAVRLPVLVFAWWATAKLRRGDPEAHIGGMKHWWIMPLLYQAAPSVGLVSNMARHPH